MTKKTAIDTSELRDLGLFKRNIDRRDFTGMLLTGASALALQGLTGCGPLTGNRSASYAADSVKSLPDSPSWTMSPHEWNGFSGDGDYAKSNGNVFSVVNAAHRMRDALVAQKNIDQAGSTGEEYALIVVGGGPSGLGAAYHFRQRAEQNAKCLVLENHPLFGGLAKQNEMNVDGTRLIAPQGSNVFVSATADEWAGGVMNTKDVLDKIGLDTNALTYAQLTGSEKALEFDRTNYTSYFPPANSDSLGFFWADEKGYSLHRNAWATAFNDAPLPGSLKQELMRWRFETELPESVKDPAAFLDSMTYENYMRSVHGFSDQFCQLINKFIGGGKAFNGGICSAYALSFNKYPGLVKRDFSSMEERFSSAEKRGVRIDGLPGGNGTVARFFTKYLINDVISGETTEDVFTQPINFDALDRPGNTTRIRTQSTVVSVRHNGDPKTADYVEVIYERAGRLYKVRAKNVVIAAGAWVSKHILKDAPSYLNNALASLKHSPILVANVALKNWRALEKAGVTACLWSDGDFGFHCSIRRPMQEGSFTPPLDPDKPIFLTFYAPFVYPGYDAAAQTALGRRELFTTGFSSFEARIRKQLAQLLGPYGFDPARDIAGIILNRWGHAYVCPEPGFFKSVDGKATAREIIREGYGRVRFAHSELFGFQSYETAMAQSQMAVDGLNM